MAAKEDAQGVEENIDPKNFYIGSQIHNYLVRETPAQLSQNSI